EVSAEFGEAVHRETEGNPFFVEEVLKALIEQGSVRRESGRWKRCDVGELVIPQSVKEAIGNRLDRVSEQSNEVLRVAAVLGKTFSFDELQAAAENTSEDALLDAPDESVTSQLVVATGKDSFTFTHDKIREVLYEELNPIRRRRLHRQAAQGLEQRDGGSACTVERLAYHYIQAGDYERGLTYAKRAAAEAERVFAIDEVVAASGRALECAEALGLVEEQLSLEEAIGKPYLLHGDLIPAGEHFEQAMTLTEDPQVRARLQTEAASSLVATGNQRGVEYLHEALKVLDPIKNPVETANALANEARFHHLAGRHRKAIELLKRAAELIAPAAAADTISTFAAPIITQIYAYLAGAYQHYGLYKDSNGWARRAIEFGEMHNVSFAQALGFEFLSENAIHIGEYQVGLGYADREQEIVERIHSRERRAWAYFAAAMNAAHLGDHERAEIEFTQGIALAEAVGERRVAALLRANYAALQAEQGANYSHDSVVGRALLDNALQTARSNFQTEGGSSLLYSRFESHRCLALVHFRRDELDEAERLCAAASAVVSDTESRVSKLWLGPLYMDVLLAAAKRFEHENKHDEAAARLSFAPELFAGIHKLGVECPSPRFKQEAARLEQELKKHICPASLSQEVTVRRRGASEKRKPQLKQRIAIVPDFRIS